MMLNSTNNFTKLLFVLVCSSISCSAVSKVYSWRDAEGAMHYSQFPREIVEKNAAQSRASRSNADLADVVKDLSASDAGDLLDGLDDIVANANNVREPEKVLIRRDPQLVLIEQQLAQQLAEQQVQELALLKALQAAAKLAEVNRQEQRLATLTNRNKRVEQNSFMAGIRKRVNGNINNDKPRQATLAQMQTPARTPTITPSPMPKAKEAKVIITPNDKFLAAIQNKLKRTASADKAPEDKLTEIQVVGDSQESNRKGRAEPDKPTSARQVSSALLLAAGSDQVDRQGLVRTSQFVEKINAGSQQ